MPKPPNTEKKYFGKIDVQKIKKLAESKRDKTAKKERERLKNLHWRRCGNCGMELQEVPFKGVTILKCFGCNAVLLLGDDFAKLCGEEVKVLESLMEMFKF